MLPVGTGTVPAVVTVSTELTHTARVNVVRTPTSNAQPTNLVIGFTCNNGVVRDLRPMFVQFSAYLRPLPIWGWRWPHCPWWCYTGLLQQPRSLPPCPRSPWPHKETPSPCRRCPPPARWCCTSVELQKHLRAVRVDLHYCRVFLNPASCRTLFFENFDKHCRCQFILQLLPWYLSSFLHQFAFHVYSLVAVWLSCWLLVIKPFISLRLYHKDLGSSKIMGPSRRRVKIDVDCLS